MAPSKLPYLFSQYEWITLFFPLLACSIFRLPTFGGLLDPFLKCALEAPVYPPSPLFDTETLRACFIEAYSLSIFTSALRPGSFLCGGNLKFPRCHSITVTSNSYFSKENSMHRRNAHFTTLHPAFSSEFATLFPFSSPFPLMLHGKLP